MLILIDRAGAQACRYRTGTHEYGDPRRYYCAQAPHRAVVVCRHDLDLPLLIGQVVEVSIGNERGWQGFVREDNVGQWHTKITLRRISQRRAEKTLSAILAAAPQDTYKERARDEHSQT